MIEDWWRWFKFFSCGQHEDIDSDQTLSIHSSLVDFNRSDFSFVILVPNIFKSQYLGQYLTVIHVGYSFWVYLTRFSHFGFGRVALETIFLNTMEGWWCWYKFINYGQHEDIHADQTLSIHSSCVDFNRSDFHFWFSCSITFNLNT